MKINGEQVTSDILNWLDTLKVKPKLIIPASEISYDIVSLYLNGYLDGIASISERNVSRSIVNWYEVEAYDLISCGITQYIRSKNKDKSDAELVSLLLDTIKKFFLENSNWEIEDITRSQTFYDKIITDGDWLNSPD